MFKLKNTEKNLKLLKYLYQNYNNFNHLPKFSFEKFLEFIFQFKFDNTQNNWITFIDEGLYFQEVSTTFTISIEEYDYEEI